jgi:hypothetical protein
VGIFDKEKGREREIILRSMLYKKKKEEKNE